MILKATRCLFISACVLMLCAAAAVAQDAGQTLRLSVGYNTLKNSTTLSQAKRDEVDRLGKMAQAATVTGRFGEAMKHYLHAITIMRGGEWTPARALSTALTLKPELAVLEPSQSVRARVGQTFALDERPSGKFSGTISLLKMQGDEPVKSLKTIEFIEPDFMTSPAIIELIVPDVEPGNYRLMLTLRQQSASPSAINETSASETVTKTATVHIERGLAARLSASRTRAASVEAKLESIHQNSLLASLRSAQYRLSLFDLANAGDISLDRINFSEEIKEADALLDDLEASRDPFASRRGDLRKAYLSKEDSSLQPYRIFIPSSYDATKPYPLIIALHGMGGDENSYFDSYGKGAFKIEAERRGYIVACPKGRQPASMYIGAAERDVMDVIEDVKRAYRIDPDRIYLTGHSMGGYGTWSIAMRHPEVFASLAPVAGGGNPMLMSKIAQVPQLVIHGEADKTVAVEQSRVMVAAAKKLQVEVNYIEIPNGDHISVALRTFKDVFDWFDAHRRRAPEAKAAGAKAN